MGRIKVFPTNKNKRTKKKKEKKKIYKEGKRDLYGNETYDWLVDTISATHSM